METTTLRTPNRNRATAMRELADYLDGILNVMDVETSQIGGG